jgi:hypothetical protein
MLREVEPDFTGMIVRVFCAELDEHWKWLTLDEPSFERQHGRIFLVGKLSEPIPFQRDWWGRNVRVCLPWDEIKYYHTERIPDRYQRKAGGAGMPTTAE